jgi:hypothetical protein
MRLVTAGANAGDLEQWPGSSTRPEPSLSKTGFDPQEPLGVRTNEWLLLEVQQPAVAATTAHSEALSANTPK